MLLVLTVLVLVVLVLVAMLLRCGASSRAAAGAALVSCWNSHPAEQSCGGFRFHPDGGQCGGGEEARRHHGQLSKGGCTNYCINRMVTLRIVIRIFVRCQLRIVLRAFVYPIHRHVCNRECSYEYRIPGVSYQGILVDQSQLRSRRRFTATLARP